MHLCLENASLCRSNMNYNLSRYVFLLCQCIKPDFLPDTNKLKFSRWNATIKCHTCAPSHWTGIQGLQIFLLPHSPLLLKAMVWIFWPGYQKIPHLILYERQLQGNEISQQKHKNIHNFEEKIWTHSSYFSMEVLGNSRFFFFFLTVKVSNLHKFNSISISERLLNLLL